MPLWASSTTAQHAGGSARAAAAFRNTSGSGLLREIMPPSMRASNSAVRPSFYFQKPESQTRVKRRNTMWRTGIPVLSSSLCGRKCKPHGRMPAAGTAPSHPLPTKSSAVTVAVGMVERPGILPPTGTPSGSVLARRLAAQNVNAATFTPRNWMLPSADP